MVSQLGDFKWYLAWRFQNGISLGDFKIISQRDILNNVPTWRYFEYKLIEISYIQEMKDIEVCFVVVVEELYKYFFEYSRDGEN